MEDALKPIKNVPLSVKIELPPDVLKEFKIKLIGENKMITTKVKELITEYVQGKLIPPELPIEPEAPQDPIAPELVSVEAISVKVDMASIPDKWDEYKAELEGGEVIVPTSKFSKPAAVLSKAEKLAILGLKPSPRPEKVPEPKSTGFSTSHGKVEGKVKRIGDQYSIVLSDGRSFTVEDREFHIDGRTFDFKEMRPSMLFDISLFEISDQTPYLELFQIEKSDQEKTDQATFTDLFLSGLNPNNIDQYALEQYMKGDDVTQPDPPEEIVLPKFIPLDQRK